MALACFDLARAVGRVPSCQACSRNAEAAEEQDGLQRRVWLGSAGPLGLVPTGRCSFDGGAPVACAPDHARPAGRQQHPRLLTRYAAWRRFLAFRPGPARVATSNVRSGRRRIVRELSGDAGHIAEATACHCQAAWPGRPAKRRLWLDDDDARRRTADSRQRLDHHRGFFLVPTLAGCRHLSQSYPRRYQSGQVDINCRIFKCGYRLTR